MQTIQTVLNLLGARKDLSQEQMNFVMQSILQGHLSEIEIAAFLMGLKTKGESVDEITYAIKNLQNYMIKIDYNNDVIDVCGTGGDGLHTLNVSTAVVFVLASMGIKVAKHGNRAVSSQTGSADVLEELGIPINIDEKQAIKWLDDKNYCFLFAPYYHPALKYIMPVRKALGIRTIFNILGPLLNPTRPKFQIIGVYDKKWLKPIAETLHNLGTKRAWVIYGNDGLDEITPATTSSIVSLNDGKIEEFTFNPQDYGFQYHSLNAIKGGDAKYNANALKDLFKNPQGAYFDTVLLNAAAAVTVYHNIDYAEALNKVKQAFIEGVRVD